MLLLSCVFHLALNAAEPLPAAHEPPLMQTPSATGAEPAFPFEDLIGKPTQETDRFLSQFVSMLATLGLIIALILFIAWFLKRMVNAKIEGENATSAIQILEKRNLSQRTTLYMIEVNGKGILVAESQNGVASLGTYPVEEEEPKDDSPPDNLPKPFVDLLKKK